MSNSLRQAILEMLTQIERIAILRANVDLMFRAQALRTDLREF